MKVSNFKFLETKIPKGKQLLLNFGKYELSIVQNESSYGNKLGLFEIGVFQNDTMIELPGITREGDTVKGFLTEDDVNVILKKMYLITGTVPEQVV